MKLNRDEFLETGYLIVKEAVPRDKLVRLPDAFEFVTWHGFLDNEVAGFQKFVAVEFHGRLQSGLA